MKAGPTFWRILVPPPPGGIRSFFSPSSLNFLEIFVAVVVVVVVPIFFTTLATTTTATTINTTTINTTTAASSSSQDVSKNASFSSSNCKARSFSSSFPSRSYAYQLSESFREVFRDRKTRYEKIFLRLVPRCYRRHHHRYSGIQILPWMFYRAYL